MCAREPRFRQWECSGSECSSDLSPSVSLTTCLPVPATAVLCSVQLGFSNALDCSDVLQKTDCGLLAEASLWGVCLLSLCLLCLHPSAVQKHACWENWWLTKLTVVISGYVIKKKKIWSQFTTTVTSMISPNCRWSPAGSGRGCHLPQAVGVNLKSCKMTSSPEESIDLLAELVILFVFLTYLL